VLNVGVLSIQGAVSEHADRLVETFEQLGISGRVHLIRNASDIEGIDGLILPGGESTTISKNLVKRRLFESIKARISEESLPVFGTCAGCVLLSDRVVDDKKGVKVFSAMSMEVRRNAFGSQCFSFEQDIDVSMFDSAFPGVFIRAPIIEKVWDNCSVIARFDEKIVGAMQDKFLALSFHPELTNDLRFHQLFVEKI